ncbi:MAG: hypothetical protein OXF55_01330 [Caldilineaceae bacterium]|nr:hypothetical protein [Caldilineaceae bacterium]
MLRVLFIEDDKEAIKTILDRIDQDERDIERSECDFHEAEEKIWALRPDIVVLDLFEGALLRENDRGSDLLGLIWEKQFFPVVVHTALPEALEGYENPFVHVLKKGIESSETVLEAIRSLEPHVRSLKEVDKHIRESFAFALRDVAPFAYETFEEAKQRNDAILRGGRRRLAALMDEHPGTDQVLASWEQYICPPLSQDMLLGDILRKTDKEGADPSLFRVVLSPSCDLVSSGGREPKVREILVAKCCSTKRGIEFLGWGNMNTRKLKDRLDSVLSRGYSEALVPLPALRGRVPTMMANLRELELIPFGDVGCESDRFLRVASLDSPFRELISWAYIQASGRPGLPDRDLTFWREEIVADFQS